MNRMQRRARAPATTSIAGKVLVALEQEFRVKMRDELPPSSRRAAADALRVYARDAMAFDMTLALKLWDLADAFWSLPIPVEEPPS